MYGLAGLMVVASIVIFILYRIRLGSQSGYKAKWDFMNENQIKYYWYSVLSLAIAVGLVANTIDNHTVALSVIWLFIRMFISIAAGTLVGYIIYLILKFYYPGRLQKKLNRLRYAPRISSAGNKMKLLSEEEEDVHLDAGQQAEENVFSIDYDVWVDPSSNEVKIEKYPGNLVAYKCNNCSFQTMRLKREEIIAPATEESEGELLKHFECSYCKSIRTTQHTIKPAVKDDSEYKIPEHAVFKGDRLITSIMVQIVSNDGVSQDFYFQNKKEAAKFLDEFMLDKVEEE